jgi:hypothetical protein
MGTRIGTIGGLAAFAAIAASAQPYGVAQALSTEFLTGLAQQGLLPSQVAIINANVGSIIILDRNASGSVVFIDGADNFVRSQLAKQLAESVAQEEPMHLTVKHRSFEATSCSAVIEQRTEFLARLDAFDSNASGTPPTSSLQEIMLDATTYLIITSGRDAVVTIRPNGPLDPPLQQAAGRLHSAVSRCAGSVIPQVQQHAF